MPRRAAIAVTVVFILAFGMPSWAAQPFYVGKWGTHPAKQSCAAYPTEITAKGMFSEDENCHFKKIRQGDTPHWYHIEALCESDTYGKKKQSIDFSGDADQMRMFEGNIVTDLYRCKGKR